MDELNNIGTAEAFEKSRFVVQAFSDGNHKYMTYAPTVQRVSQRLFLCIDHCDDKFILFLRDITQACTQSKKSIILRIYIESPPSPQIFDDQILQVICPLYHLPEICLLWFETYHTNHVTNLFLTAAVHDMFFILS